MKKSNAMSVVQVQHIAKLANIFLTHQEAEKIAKGLSETLDFINRIKKVDTTGIGVTSNVTGLENVFREDRVVSSFSQIEALSGTDSTYQGYFKIRAILEK